MSLLKSVLRGFHKEELKNSFIKKIHEETGIPEETLEEVYSHALTEGEKTGKNNPEAWAKLNVYTFLESNKYTSTAHSSRERGGNFVAKHMNTFNKASTHRDRKKASKRGDRKHKTAFEDSPISKTDETKKFAKWLAFKAMKYDSTSQEVLDHAKTLEDRGDKDAQAWFLAATLVDKREQEMEQDAVDFRLKKLSQTKSFDGSSNNNRIGEEDEVMFQIIDTKTKEPVGEPSTNKLRLTRRADKLDNQYGAVRYIVKRSTSTS